jgi:fatty-acyl-CoA synthase
MDSRGYMKVTGRLKDMIIRGGENIFPREIEDRLHRHPAVGDVAVVGIPDPRWGEQVAAFVRPTETHAVTQEELMAFLRADLAPSKLPRIWVSIAELPLTPSGKIQKFVLREQYCAGSYEPMP